MLQVLALKEAEGNIVNVDVAFEERVITPESMIDDLAGDNLKGNNDSGL